MGRHQALRLGVVVALVAGVFSSATAAQANRATHNYVAAPLAASETNPVIVDTPAAHLAPNDCLGPNLVFNPGAEDPLVDGEIPEWTEVVGTDWQPRTDDPPPALGTAYFSAGQVELAELRQDVHVGVYAAFVDGGDQPFHFGAAIRTTDETPGASARILVEYRDATNTVVLDAYDSGEVQSPLSWQSLEDQRTAPAGTRFIRIRLIANGGYFDAVDLRSYGTPVLTVGNAAAGEGDTGTTQADFTLTLSCPVAVDTSVDYATADGSGLSGALAGFDYEAASGVVVIPAGSTTATVPVPVIGDDLVEDHEWFLLTVSSADPLVIPFPIGTGLILDDDLTIRAQIQAVHDFIAGLEADDKHVAKALAHLDKALDEDLWDNGDLLGDQGKKAFKELRKAVKELGKVDEPLAAIASGEAETLADLAEELAQNAVDAAAGGDPKDLAKALAEMEKAAADRADGRSEKAIDHYRKAWEKARDAIDA